MAAELPPPYTPYPPAGAVTQSPENDYIPNPVIPYIGPVPQLRDGSMIVIQGTVADIKGKRSHIFNIGLNLSYGTAITGRVDSALVICPHVEEKGGFIIRNSCLKGTWGDEEKWGLDPTISPGTQFEMIILTTNDHYKIAVNGNHYCEFKHRIPFSQVSHLSIEGDVMINFIRHQGRAAPLPSSPVSAAAGASNSAVNNTVTHNTVTTVYRTEPVVEPVIVPVIGHHHHHILPHLLHDHHHHGHHHHGHHGFGRRHGFGGHHGFRR